MEPENESIAEKALLEKIVSSAKENPLYAPGTGKASLRDIIVMWLFFLLMILVGLAFVALGLFLIYLIYIFWREGVPFGEREFL